MDSRKRVQLLKIEMLKPAEACESRRLELSPHDRAMRYAGYQKRIVFYRKPAAADAPASAAAAAADLAAAAPSFPAVVDSLRSSLSKVLVHFFPLAGRLLQTPLTMEVDCSSLSVQFSSARTEARIEDVENSSFEPSEFCDQLCEIGSPAWPWSPDFPLLLVQVTEFACGGFSIGFSFSHQICDGPSAWHFFKSWSEMNKGYPISDSPVITFSRKGLDMDLETTLRVAETIGYKLVEEQPTPVFVTPDKLRTKRFTVDKEAISRLKILAAETSSSSGKRFSTYQVLVAYFWKQATIARCLPDEQRLNFLLVMNSRNRFGGLPSFYFGNAATSMFIVCTVKDLVQNDIGYTADLLQKSITSFNEEKAQAEVNFLDYVIPQGYISKFEVDAKGFAMVVSSPRYPIFESDFGYGRPVGVSIGTNDMHEGKFYFFPSSEEGSVDVTVVLQPDALARLSIEI